MATDLRLQQRPNGRYDFKRTATGGLEKTDDVAPALLRLALQRSWLGDDGERSGPSLSDLRIDNGDAATQAQQILETRYGLLVRRGDLESFEVTGVESTDEGGLLVDVTYTQPGRKPQPLLIQVLR